MTVQSARDDEDAVVPAPAPARGQRSDQGRARILVEQLVKFALVGGVGFVVDFAVFNLLRITILSPDQLHEGPLVAKVVSTLLAITTNGLGNRYWTFAAQRRRASAREAIEFFLASFVGMAVGLLCLWVSHYVLGFTSLLADNISSNVIGLLLGAAVRFALYRLWVFNPRRR